jgi:hypothetical protein
MLDSLGLFGYTRLSLNKFSIDRNTTTKSPAHEMAQTEKTNFSNKERRMFGLGLDFWNNLMVGFLGIGAIAAVIVGIATYAVIRLQKAEAKDASDAYELYKLGVAAQVADAKREGIEAGRTAGDALVRAAELEKEAANARLETEKIKRAVAWRVISPEDALKLEKALVAKPGSVNLRYTDGDPEALYLAVQISQILTKANWHIAPGAIKPSNAIFFGIGLPDANGGDSQTLRGAFSAANIRFSISALPSGGVGFSISTIAGAPTLMIGSKQPALP